MPPEAARKHRCCSGALRPERFEVALEEPWSAVVQRRVADYRAGATIAAASAQLVRFVVMVPESAVAAPGVPPVAGCQAKAS